MADRDDAAQTNVEYVGPWADIHEAAKHLRVSPSEVSARVERRELLGMRFADGDLYLPVRQFFGNGRIVPGLREVLDELATGIDSPEVWATWLAAPAEPMLGGEGDHPTGLDLLTAGEVKTVLLEASRDASIWHH
jgi:hypothetical protein